jgi:integrase
LPPPQGAEKTLTMPMSESYNPASILESLGVNMKGIRPKGKCRKCGGTFTFDKDHGFQCSECLTTPKRYQIDFSFKGKRIRRETTLEGKTLETFSDAFALLAQARTEIEEKKFDPAKWRSKDRLEFRFGYLIERWYQDKLRLAEQGKLAPAYPTLLRGYIDRYFGPLSGSDVREIKRRDIEELSMTLTGALSTQKNVLDTLRGFFNWLYRGEVIERVPGFPTVDVPDRDPAIITTEQQADILFRIPKKHRPIFAWLFAQGCRIGEARALKWDSVQGDVVTYKRTFSGETLKDTTKTRRNRCNLIFPEALAALPPRRFPLDFVFTHGKEGRPYSAVLLHVIFKKAARAAGIEITLYEATKHSFGTRMVNEAGASLDVLQAHFGHTNKKSTLIYSRLKPVEGMRKVFELRERRKHTDANTTNAK